ncbi:MAG: 2-oxo acid dehydrogenase subunit E2 [Acinetobacter sp.]|nr:2-oxo acid dehydrogenase subunit E2 [Acinetobacter sp.]
MIVNTPDIGVDKALVSEILVQVGDSVSVDQSIFVLESDKATVEVPSTVAGVVKAILVKKDDSVSEGVALIEIEAGEASNTAEPAPAVETASVAEQKAVETPVAAATSSAPSAGASVEITVPDIGVDKALVTEILIKVGDTIEVDQSIAVLESDKATVEVPSTVAGVVEAIHISLNQSVTEGVALAKVITGGTVTAVPTETTVSTPVVTAESSAPVAASGSVEITVPDIGVDKALVTEILIKVGDTIEVDQSIAVLESDKATVEVPSTVAGVVEAIHISLNQSVTEGVALAKVAAKGATSVAATSAPAAPSKVETPVAPSAPVAPVTTAAPTSSDKLTAEQEAENAKVYAGPAVRKLARELGVILSQVKGTGTQQRILKDDVFAYVKTRLTAPVAAAPIATAVAAAGLPPLPDFTAFGGGEVQTMTRLQQVSVPQLSLNNFIPQVTQFDLADITELEAWRNELKDGFKKQGISLTILAFIAKAVAHLLLEERYFASHLADDQKSVLLRNEIHMGIAVATPDGLTVPVLRNPDQKSIKQIAQELAELSQKARDKKLSPKDLQGANFTITSLGSIGGTAFTPLVNWPQVAILGISPAKMQPVWNGKDFEPRLMLPLSLSYDHRVINGADAARFTNKLTKLLQDIRTLLL